MKMTKKMSYLLSFLEGTEAAPITFGPNSPTLRAMATKSCIDGGYDLAEALRRYPQLDLNFRNRGDQSLLFIAFNAKNDHAVDVLLKEHRFNIDISEFDCWLRFLPNDAFEAEKSSRDHLLKKIHAEHHRRKGFFLFLSSLSSFGMSTPPKKTFA